MLKARDGSTLPLSGISNLSLWRCLPQDAHWGVYAVLLPMFILSSLPLLWVCVSLWFAETRSLPSSSLTSSLPRLGQVPGQENHKAHRPASWKWRGNWWGKSSGLFWERTLPLIAVWPCSVTVSLNLNSSEKWGDPTYLITLWASKEEKQPCKCFENCELG